MTTVGRHLCLFGDAISIHVQRWAREMLQRGWRVSLVTARPEPIPGVQQIVLRPVSHSLHWLARVGEARRALQQLQPDLVHAHYLTSYGYLAARCARHPLVMSAWGTDLLVTPKRNPLLRGLTRWTLGQADLVTGDSLDLLDEARSLCPSVRAELIHWGVDLDRFAPAAWTDKPGFEAVSLRSWEPNYNISVILDAFATVLQQCPSARLHVLGGGSQRADLQEQVQRLGIASAVHLHGRMDDAGMADVLRRCKLSISVPTSDATSVSVLESMASGLAVIASDLPANRQWLQPQALVPAGDVSQLAERWLQWLQQNDATARLAADNALRMQHEGSRQQQMDMVHRLYTELLMTSPRTQNSP